MNLVEKLVKKGSLTKEEAAVLQKTAAMSEESVEEIMLKENILPEEDLFRAKAELLNVPLEKQFFSEISPEVLEFVPKDSAEHYKMLPLEKKNNTLKIGMVFPENLKAQEALNFLARQKKFNYRIVLITFADFQKYLKHYQSLKKEVKLALDELQGQLQQKAQKVPKGSVSPDVVEKRGEAPISKTVAVILKHAVEGKSSDVHVEPQTDKTRVRFRLDGVLHSSLFLPPEVHASVLARIKIISGLKIDETRIPQDGRFSVTISKQNIDFRVSVFPTTLGEKVVMRVLNPSERLNTFEELGIEGQNLEIIKETVKKPYGMILATGPTGSGKTTTLYVILDLLNQEGVNVVTLEDPVEYFIKGVSQSQVRPEIGYNFANGLRNVLRQDPDIIMVGEIRDEETAELATHAALTGHIVLSTLHTNNALGAIPRMADLGVREFLLPSTIRIALAQRLVRKLCPHCRKKVRPNERIKEIILEETSNMPSKIKEQHKIGKDIWVWEPVGCRQCSEKGYSGRIGIFEILQMTKELADIVMSGIDEGKIGREAKRQGMLTLRQDGLIKVLKGKTSMEELIRTTSEAEE